MSKTDEEEEIRVRGLEERSEEQEMFQHQTNRSGVRAPQR